MIAKVARPRHLFHLFFVEFLPRKPCLPLRSCKVRGETEDLHSRGRCGFLPDSEPCPELCEPMRGRGQWSSGYPFCRRTAPYSYPRERQRSGRSSLIRWIFRGAFGRTSSAPRRSRTPASICLLPGGIRWNGRCARICRPRPHRASRTLLLCEEWSELLRRKERHGMVRPGPARKRTPQFEKFAHPSEFRAHKDLGRGRCSP